MKRPDLSQRSSGTASRFLGRAGRLVLTIAALAQLFGVVAGPLDHWRASTRMGAHLEETGSTQSHYAHDETTCVACSIGHMAASPARRGAGVSLGCSGPAVACNVAHLSPFRVPRTHAAPRAPPVPSLAG